MSLKGILFDFNGTLVFDSDMHVEAFKRTYEIYGKEVPSSDFIMRNFFGKPNRNIYAENFDPSYTEEALKRFIHIKENLYYDICRELGSEYRLADGAVEMLDYVKASGIPYCLATGSERSGVEFFIETLGIGKWFEFDKNIVYEDGSFKGKPAPDIYEIAAAKIGLCPEECLVFEDGISGLLSANAARAGGVVAVYEEKYPSPLTRGATADKVFHDHMAWKETFKHYGLMR